MQDLSTIAKALAAIAPPPCGVIGFCGTAGSGKSYMAQAVMRACGYPVQVMSFASPLKAMTHSLLTVMGIENGRCERMIHDDLKEAEIDPILFPGLTTRRIMQTLGTEWGRATIERDLWTKIMLARVTHARADGYAVIIDDVRFQNEVELIRNLGGKVVRVHNPRGPQAETNPAHVSELLPLYDETYLNEVPA